MGGLCCSEKLPPIDETQVNASHFEIMKVVGKGGFGKVNAVMHRPTNTMMAMKRMSKKKLIKKDAYVVTSWRERNIMAQLSSPFLVNLLYAFQDKEDLFVIMPFMQGGDLRYYLNTVGPMNEEVARFYAAEVILGLEELHSKHIAYRDLKPDNILFDSQGHMRISDFGLGVILKEKNRYRTKGSAGTAGYQAPEIMQRKTYTTTADIWSFGITLYEMLNCARPFSKSEDFSNPRQDYRVNFMVKVTPECKTLIRGLLRIDAKQRLGAGVGDWDEVKNHEWFKSINWYEMLAKKHEAPFKPKPGWAYCSPDHELQEQFLEEKSKDPDLTEEQQMRFKHYEYNTDLKGKPPSNATNGTDAHELAVPVTQNKPSQTVVSEVLESEIDHEDQEISEQLKERDSVVVVPERTSNQDVRPSISVANRQTSSKIKFSAPHEVQESQDPVSDQVEEDGPDPEEEAAEKLERAPSSNFVAGEGDATPTT
eukprot:gb/GEZN01003422.1/.p1 GENE.gb/GEZN01003422.1/~~gb/GEZN01003422.1/.p1  ORF type:complete len:480 (-),score=88.73 gb/GEZN01003422.1/:362-1801(-)